VIRHADRLSTDCRTRGFELLSAEPSPTPHAARLVKPSRSWTRVRAVGDLPVVLAGGSAHLVSRSVRSRTRADAILKQASVYAGKVGQLVASLCDPGR